MTVEQLLKDLKDLPLNAEVVVSEFKQVGEYTLKMDTPIIGFTFDNETNEACFITHIDSDIQPE